MGLPQVSSGSIAEEMAVSLSTFVPNTPRNVGLRSCDLSAMHGGNLGNRIQMESPCSSFGEFQRRTIPEFPKEPDYSTMHKDGTSSKHKWKLNSMEQNGLFPGISGRNIQRPVPRIVGFESRALSSPVNVFDGIQSSSNVANIKDNPDECTASVVRKRLLSPLNGMLLSDQVNGKSLDIGNGVDHGNYRSGNDPRNVYVSPEHKRAHKGDSTYFNTPICSLSCSPEWRNSLDYDRGSKSTLLADGPLLVRQEFQCHDHFKASPEFNYLGESNEVRTKTGAIAIAPTPKKVVSPPLSLSPLGPKFPERAICMGGRRDNTIEVDDNNITFKDMKQSLDGTFSDYLSSKRNNTQISGKSSEDLDNLQKFGLSISQNTTSMGRHWNQDSDITSNVKLVRSLSGLPIRRSLVGSFEESLLSGRLLSGRASQRIKGFLAVLNVTGGNFSPKPQKLPFGVTSVDGDKYLYYYSTIDLPANMAASKDRGAKTKKNLSIDESQAEKSRLRIPMKGRIQLVRGYL